MTIISLYYELNYKSNIMKNVSIVALIAIFSFTSMNAQDITFGAKAGVNIATITGDDTDGIDSRTSFHIGAVVEIPISDDFSVQSELLYSSQGAKGKSLGGDIDFKYNYLNLPIMAKYYVAENFSLEAGPQVGLLLSAKVESDENTTIELATSKANEVDVKDVTSSIDFGLKFGAGYKLESGLNFGAHYNLGLSNIYDGEGSDNTKIHNGVFQVSVGYFF
jgi:hypothetical protein